MKPKRMTLEDKLWLHQRDQDLKHATLVGGIAGSVSMTGITIFGSRFLHATRFRQVSLIGLSLVIGSVTGYLYADAQALQQLDELATTSVLRQEFQSYAQEITAAHQHNTSTPVLREDQIRDLLDKPSASKP